MMRDSSGLLVVRQPGKRTVVGFRQDAFEQSLDVSGFHRELAELIQEHAREDLSFDLAGVQVLPSAILAEMVILHRRGIALSVFHVSAPIHETLRVTRLDQLIRMRDGEEA
jgi:hypothetical protein